MSSLENLTHLVAGIALAGAGVTLLAASGRELRLQHAPHLTDRLVRLCLAIAPAALGAGLVVRGAEAGRWPVGTRYEFTLLLALFLVATYALLRRRAPQPQLGATISILGLALLIGARFTQPDAAATQTLPPVMQGLWFPLHSLLLALACSLLALAGSAAALQQIAPQLQLSPTVDWGMNLGYVALGLGMIAGAIWGELAWGEYWTWSIKEVWTLAAWWVCTMYMHVRHRRSWRGARALWVATLACVLALATVYLTPWLVRWTRLVGPPIY